MRFGPVATASAEGAILAHSLLVGGVRIGKGARLSAADIAAIAAGGIETLVVAQPDPGDLDEDQAAATIAAALAGAGLVADPAAHGRANIRAEADGLVCLDAAMVDALNAIDEAITLATLSPFARVRRGDVVATVKIIPFAVPGATVERCRTRAESLRLAAFAPRRVRLVQTLLAGTGAKLLAKTAEVARARVAALGLADWTEVRVPHEEAALAQALTTALDDGAELLLVAGASAITDRRDVVPAAIIAAGGTVERLGMPVEPGNLICMGRVGRVPVIGLPGCARSPKRNGVDWVLERLFAGIDAGAGAIAGMGVGGLLADGARPEPRPQYQPDAGAGVVGALVLAAGRSVRMGANKLTADLAGRPVLSHVLAAVDAARLPAIVVTGHDADAVAAIAAPRAIVHAARYAEGLSQTLAAGIRAVPADWSAAVVVLGDMPALTATDLAAIAERASDDAIVVPVHDGKRGNPVAWGRRFFGRLGAIEGDVGGKALLAEFSDAVVEVEASGDGILVDVDTPEALAALRARYSS